MNSRLKELRKRLSISQTELAKKLNTSKSYICRIESGERPLSDKMKSEICNIYSINKEWLDTGCGEMFIKHSGANPVFVDMVYHALLSLSDEQWNKIEELRATKQSVSYK